MRSPLKVRILSALATLAGFTLLPPIALTAQNVVKEVNSAVRDHHIFVGVELFVETDGEMTPVSKLEGDKVVVRDAAGQRVEVTNPTAFRWRLTPKVAPRSVKIGQIDAHAAYAPGSDPSREWTSDQVELMDYYTDRVSIAEQAIRRADVGPPAVAGSAPPGGMGGPPPTAPDVDYTAIAMDSFEQASNSLSQMTHSRFNAGPGTGKDEPQYDAIQMNFQVSSPAPIADASVLVLNRIRKADGQMVDTNFYGAIGSIGREPRIVQLLQPGLAPGFEVLTTEIHVFNQGEELPTNYSERHMPLTAEEARQFEIMSHLAEHRGETVPAAVAWSLAPDELRSAQNATAYDFPATVSLDADGRPLNIAAAGQGILPPNIKAILQGLTYLPALDQGEPVATTLHVNVADYFR